MSLEAAKKHLKGFLTNIFSLFFIYLVLIFKVVIIQKFKTKSLFFNI